MSDQELETVEDSEPDRILHSNSQSTRISSQILNYGLVSSDVIELTDEEPDVDVPPFYGEGIINLGRFAYLNTQPSKVATSSASSTAASKVFEPSPKTSSAKVQPRKACFVIDGLSENHFAKLTKCVSCDVRWTTRKTVGQKMMHIKSCSKKNGLTVETIRVAVLREVAITKAAAAVDLIDKDEEKPRKSEAAPTTLLKDTVAAVAGKRTRRRLPKSVQRGTQTRDAILERAKEVLLHSAQITECSDLSQTDSAHDDKDQLPSTQPFGQSILACESVTKSELFAAASTDVAGKNECQVENSKHSSSGTLTIHKRRYDSSTLIQAKSPHAGPERQEAEKQDCNASRWNGRLTGKDVLASVDDTNEEPSQKDEQWIKQFRTLILQDRNLHMSILHYEPIHFDVFRTLAEANGLKTIKIKTLLRSFLDREAIHYYGAEPQGSRIRKD